MSNTQSPHTPQTTRPVLKRNREDKENLILKAACEIFCLKGFELATTKEIARKAGCAEGLIFKYFEGKTKLLVRLMERGMQRAQQELLNLPEIPNSLEDDILIIASWITKSFCNERKIFQIYMSQRLIQNKCISNSLIREEFLRTRNSVIMSRLKKHQLAGHLDKNIHLENLVELIHSYCIYISVLLPAYKTEAVLNDVEEKVKQFVHIITNGCNRAID